MGAGKGRDRVDIDGVNRTAWEGSGGSPTRHRIKSQTQTHSRAYCTLTPLPDPGSGAVRRLLVLGGIHEGRATLDLEIVEIKGACVLKGCSVDPREKGGLDWVGTDVGLPFPFFFHPIPEDDGDGGDGLVVEVVKPAPAAMGPRPAVRMGHSCTLLPPQPQGNQASF